MLFQSVISGLIPGVLAIFMLMGSLYYVKQEFVDIEDVLSEDKIMLIYCIVLASGIILSVIAAYFAVNRYLRMARGKLYYI